MPDRVFAPSGVRWLLFSKIPAAWPAAKARCEAEGAVLTTLRTVSDYAALVTHLAQRNPSAGQFWVGLTTRNGLPSTNKADWRWMATQQTPSGAEWLPNEPSNYMGYEGVCGALNQNPQLLNDVPCDTACPFACELPGELRVGRKGGREGEQPHETLMP